MKRQETSWVSYSMWRCSRHIPASKMYPAMILRCPSCQQLRPDESDRPPLVPISEEAPVVVQAPAPVVGHPASTVETKPVVGPPAPIVEAPEPHIEWDDGPEPELDEEPGAEIESQPPTKVESKADPVVPLPKKGRCPAPRCRKVSRSNSPYCSKICSDRCLRLRKKFAKTTLTDQEARWLNTILLTLGSWGWDRDAG